MGFIRLSVFFESWYLPWSCKVFPLPANASLMVNLSIISVRAHVSAASQSDNGSSRSRVFLNDLLDLPLICDSVFLEQVVCICLGGGFGVGLVKQFLDAKEDLFDGDGRFPAFLFVQD
jgi:hypothetical protein